MSLHELANRYGTDKGDWQGFCKYYERYLPGPDAPTHLLELGVYEGKSLQLWDNYFMHYDSRIFGVDIDFSRMVDSCFLSDRVQLHLADQASLGLASRIRTEGYVLDVVIDDASHISSKTIASFHTWWPTLSPGGLYVVEDTHCSYDTEHYGYESAGGPTDLGMLQVNKATTMNFLKRLADDVNWDHHGRRRFNPLYTDIDYVHFYSGICFIGKK